MELTNAKKNAKMTRSHFQVVRNVLLDKHSGKDIYTLVWKTNVELNLDSACLEGQGEVNLCRGL